MGFYSAFAETKSCSASVVIEEDKLYNHEIEHKYEHANTLDVLKRHQLQLGKLEELVKSFLLACF